MTKLNVKKKLSFTTLGRVTAQRNVLRNQLVATRFAQRNRLFFSWVFNLVFRHRLQLDKITQRRTGREVPRPRYVKKQGWGPRLNLRIYALQTRLLKHGHKSRSRRIIENLIILLNENIKDKRGLMVLNSVLARLEPPYGMVSRRRGREVFVYPVPIWPARRRFLAARLLAEGARQFQVFHRCSFVVALYSEVCGVFNKLPDCFTQKLYNRLVRLGLKHRYVARRFVKKSRV